MWTPLCVWYHALRTLNGKGVHPHCCVWYRIVHSSDQLLANYRPSCCNQMPPQLWWLDGPNASVWWGPKHLPDARNCGQNNWPRKSVFICTEVETELTRYKNSHVLVKRSIVTHWLMIIYFKLRRDNKYLFLKNYYNNFSLSPPDAFLKSLFTIFLPQYIMWVIDKFFVIYWQVCRENGSRWAACLGEMFPYRGWFSSTATKNINN